VIRDVSAFSGLLNATAVRFIKEKSAVDTHGRKPVGIYSGRLFGFCTAAALQFTKTAACRGVADK